MVRVAAQTGAALALQCRRRCCRRHSARAGPRRRCRPRPQRSLHHQSHLPFARRIPLGPPRVQSPCAVASVHGGAHTEECSGVPQPAAPRPIACLTRPSRHRRCAICAIDGPTRSVAEQVEQGRA
eukprot:scaffold1519_cov99-Isochrysis_galbana.AAC.10